LTCPDGFHIVSSVQPPLPDSLREFVARTLAAAPPVSDSQRADLSLIIWGLLPASAEPESGPAEAA
jgi:hypothetical protein